MLPSLWIEDAETDLLETFESNFEIDDICEYDIKSLKSDKIGFKYTYYSNVSSPTHDLINYKISLTNPSHSPNHASPNPKSRTSPP